MPTIAERVNALQDDIRAGRIIDAMSEFYAADCEMQENANPPTRGLAANIEREKQFLANVKEWKAYTVKAIAVGDGIAAVESTIDFIAINGAPVHMEQVSIQRWKDGKIVHERFYYDSAGK